MQHERKRQILGELFDAERITFDAYFGQVRRILRAQRKHHEDDPASKFTYPVMLTAWERWLRADKVCKAQTEDTDARLWADAAAEEEAALADYKIAWEKHEELVAPLRKRLAEEKAALKADTVVQPLLAKVQGDEP